ncbi:hypothetical protein [Lysobacter sp. TY2-98]|uniref:hypothetical protein n=1 Tax=Lysobacter sp. TY2-98 TaxID=2290922 RepID=UPI0013B44844|nr:hypothetical protein [Lysobacter sp. TY2-98]
MFEAIPPFDETPSHARWLHDLRNMVSTASVAASVGRELVHEDIESAIEFLREAEGALQQCRDLLASGADHVRDDSRGDLPLLPLPNAAQRRRDGDAAGASPTRG